MTEPADPPTDSPRAPAHEEEQPIAIPAAAVVAFGLRLAFAMTVVGLLAAPLSIAPLWLAPYARSQGLFLLFYAIAGVVLALGLLGIGWHLVAKAPPSPTVLRIGVAIAIVCSAASCVAIRRGIRRREETALSREVGPILDALAMDATDDALHAKLPTEDPVRLRIYRGDSVMGAVVVADGSSIGTAGSTLYIVVDARGSHGDWQRIGNDDLVGRQRVDDAIAALQTAHDDKAR